MRSNFILLHVDRLNYESVNLSGKTAAQNTGCVLAYLCGGHKNKFWLQFRSSFKIHLFCGTSGNSCFCDFKQNGRAPSEGENYCLSLSFYHCFFLSKSKVKSNFISDIRIHNDKKSNFQ